MILCVCLNPAVDVTYHVPEHRAGGTVRVTTVSERAGGKAVNVARVLHALGAPVRLVAPAGDATGEELRRRLAEAGLAARLVPSGLPTRRTVTVADPTGAATTFVEPGTIDCWEGVLAATRAELSEARVLVVGGSVPGGVPDDGLASLIDAAHGRGLPVVVDTHGPPLLAALTAGADVVKPNAEELAQATGDHDAPRATRALADRFGATVVASLGSAGVVAATPGGTWEARPADALTGNATGAGDALVAGLAQALSTDPVALHDPTGALRTAVGLAAAAVHAPVAGEVDPAAYHREVTGVTVRALDGAR
jgi:1-phosphofructokinase family hexose kinase